RLLAAMILTALMSGTVCAEGLTFGVKAGMVMASISDAPKMLDTDIDWSTGSRIGMVGGVYMNYPVAGSFSFQPELLYVMKGFKADFSGTGYDFDLTGKFNYIELPLIARFAIPLEGAIKPWFCFGPSIGFNMSADFEGKYTMFDITPNMSADFSEATKKNEFSLIFGGGFEYLLGPGALTFDIRYELGLTKFIEGGEVTWVAELYGEQEEYTEEIEEQDSKNNAFIIMVGYAF
ncbi:MAG: PorT family protein, partial [Candidatus Krumholzibacteriota bacterium]|nr:PorT family protein [Candidatus Krumholzibacteriota bacterium]